MKITLPFLVLLCSLHSGISHARDMVQSSIKLSPPMSIARNINQLYLSALNENMSQPTRRSILCQQLPKLFLEYMSSVENSPNAKQQGDTLINGIKQNLKETQQYFNISCQ